ncbi:hypothetical protein [Flavobacterium cellulosilyticum]|uniref:DUF2231 domain-containing protein n=1 Tax=Flavobacterium cellulosilyticum TaxID=2541731 RepID=A0A4R5C835_9FLAO|nr:hypothetical protein [Flavobacterium cellulosilyticum]TDD94919.1 hypothetical protein E0F76_15465 [Flavobacterium cellulosilyticum]
MNDAHLHLVVNHFPIIGTFIGLGILFVGLILKNKSVKNTAFVLFIFSAIFAALSMATGDGAEKIAEKFPDVTKFIIHEHEEMAEKLALVLYLLGVIAIGGIYFNTKNHSKSTLVSFLAFTVAVLAVLLAIETGTTGGEVRHTEIRPDNINAIGGDKIISGKKQIEDKE